MPGLLSVQSLENETCLLVPSPFPSSSISCPTFLSFTAYFFPSPPSSLFPSSSPSPLLLPSSPHLPTLPSQSLFFPPLESLVSDPSDVARLTSSPAATKTSGNMSLEEEFRQAKGDWSVLHSNLKLWERDSVERGALKCNYVKWNFIFS